MTHRLARVSSLVAPILLLIAVTAVAQPPPPAPSTSEPGAEQILQKALARAEEQDKSGVELMFRYVITSIVSTLDGEGKVTKEERATSHRYPLEGLLYDEVVSRDGKPLDDNEAEEEQEKKDRFVREAREHAARGTEYKPDEMAVRFDEELMSRYDITLAGTEVIGKHTCWVIAFQPKPGRLPDNRRMDKALNRSTGKLWISKDDLGIARVAFDMREPFRYLWGLVTTIRNVSGRFDFDLVQPGFWAPIQFDLKLDLRVFFKNIRRHIHSDWLEHRPLDISSVKSNDVSLNNKHTSKI